MLWIVMPNFYSEIRLYHNKTCHTVLEYHYCFEVTRGGLKDQIKIVVMSVTCIQEERVLFFLYNAHSVSFFSRNRSVEIFDSHFVARLPNRSGHHHVRTMYNFPKVTSGDNDATWMRWRCTHCLQSESFTPVSQLWDQLGPSWSFR